MSATKRIVIGLSAALLIFNLLPSVGANASCYANSANEKGFASKINAHRKAGGKGALRLDPQLSKAAKVHTKDMVNKNLLYHTETPDLKRRVTNWSELGENVGVGSTVDSLDAAFFASPEHKANIMYTNFKYVGVGAMTKDGRLWVTVIFESKADPGSPLC